MQIVTIRDVINSHFAPRQKYFGRLELKINRVPSSSSSMFRPHWDFLNDSSIDNM